MLNTEFCIDLLEINIKMENDINNHNICVVGAGNWGRNHIRTLHQLNSLGAVVENDPQAIRFIKEEYPTCMQERANKAVACRDGYNLFDDQCYYYEDMSVLIDFIRLNPSLGKFHPLMLGYQIWEKNRLELLYLVGMGITRIPDSISNLGA